MTQIWETILQCAKEGFLAIKPRSVEVLVALLVQSAAQSLVYILGDVLPRLLTGVRKNDGVPGAGDELWMFGLETDVPHDSVWYGKRTPGGVHRYVQRLDGFISLDAGGKPGTVITKPFFLRGKVVEINADANLAQSRSTGSLLSVAVLGADGKVVAESQPIRSDGVAQRLLWKDRKDLADWVGKPVRLRFTLRYAKLFAFQVVGKLPSSGPR